MPANDGGIGPDTGSSPDRRGAEFIFARYIGARIIDVGEDTTWTAKHVVREFNAIVERDVVLNLAAVADLDARADHDVLTDRTVLANNGTRQYMAEMPDLCALTYDRAFVHVARCMNQSARKPSIFSHLRHARRAFPAKA